MLINLITFVTLAVVGSVAPVPGANALSVESHNFVRNGAGHAHAARNAALNRRQTNTARPRRCKARPTDSTLSSSASSPATTSKAQAASDAPKPTTTPAPAPPAPTSSKAADPPASPKPSSTKAVAPAPAPTQGNGGGNYNSKKACVTYVGNVDVAKFVSGSNRIGW